MKIFNIHISTELFGFQYVNANILACFEQRFPIFFQLFFTAFIAMGEKSEFDFILDFEIIIQFSEDALKGFRVLAERFQQSEHFSQ